MVSPVRFAAQDKSPARPAPLLGEQTDALRPVVKG